MTKKLNQSLWVREKSGFWLLGHGFKSVSFYLLLFLLPTQFGKHFWPSFAFLNGIRLDYFSPTLYFTDVLLFINFLFFVFFFKRKLLDFISPWRFLGIIVVILFAFLNSYFSLSPYLSAYGWFKFFEISCFVFMLYFSWLNKDVFITSLRFFVLGVCLQAGLAIAQYFNQGSIGGIWYFLGERSFTGMTPGIANASVLGQLILRPYATLPHPNLLAAYLLFAMILLCCESIITKPIFKIITLLFLYIVLLLTLSRVAIILGSLTLVYVVYRSVNRVVFGVLLVCVLFLLWNAVPQVTGRFISLSLVDESYVTRLELIKSAFGAMSGHLVWGSGMFTSLLVVSPKNNISYPQPIHMIFLLSLVELGLLFTLGWVGSFLRLLYTLRHTSYVLLGVAIITLGLVDHYFWTLQQGQLLFGFVVALLLKKSHSHTS